MNQINETQNKAEMNQINETQNKAENKAESKAESKAETNLNIISPDIWCDILLLLPKIFIFPDYRRLNKDIVNYPRTNELLKEGEQYYVISRLIYRLPKYSCKYIFNFLTTPEKELKNILPTSFRNFYDNPKTRKYTINEEEMTTQYVEKNVRKLSLGDVARNKNFNYEMLKTIIKYRVNKTYESVKKSNITKIRINVSRFDIDIIVTKLIVNLKLTNFK